MIVLKKIEVNIKNIENGLEELSINLEGMVKDELELIYRSIQTLIKQIDFGDMCNEDRGKFEWEMKKILYSVADNYVSAGYNDFSTKDKEKKEATIEDNKEKLLLKILMSYQEGDTPRNC